MAHLRYTGFAVVKVSSYKIFAIKLALFSATLAYLAGDLFIWHGMAWRTMYGGALNKSSAPPKAMVYGESITEGQLARYEADQNWLRGHWLRGPEVVNPELERTSMLMDMVRSAILRMRTRYNDKNLPDFTEAAQQEVQRLATRARSDQMFDEWLSSQGLTREEFTRRLAASMKATAQLERAVQPLCQVTDEDVALHYEQLKNELIKPAQRPLKHIFLSTVGQDARDVRRRAEELLSRLHEGEDFATLAGRYSEDSRSAPQGGDLGLVQDDGRFPLPELQIFDAESLPGGEYILKQSAWGWHILLAGELTPARELTQEEAREMLRTAIQSAQYELTTRSWFDEAIREAFFKKHLQIHAN